MLILIEKNIAAAEGTLILKSRKESESGRSSGIDLGALKKSIDRVIATDDDAPNRGISTGGSECSRGSRGSTSQGSATPTDSRRNRDEASKNTKKQRRGNRIVRSRELEMNPAGANLRN